MGPKELLELLKETGLEWSHDKAPQLGAALSYYALFSLAPLLVIAIGIAGLVFGEEGVRGQVLEQLRGTLGAEAAAVIRTMVEPREPTASITATALGLISLFFGAGGVMGQLKGSLNSIWKVESKLGGGIGELIKEKFLSFSVVLGIGFLLLLSLVVSTGVAAAIEYFGQLLPLPGAVFRVLDFGVSLMIITLLFALTFKSLPDTDIVWRDVWLGGFVTALLFTVGKVGIGLYLAHSAVASGYGAAGAIVVILIWIYYSSQILFFGAEFTKVYANRYGSRVKTAPPADTLSKLVPEQQGLPVEEGAQEHERENAPCTVGRERNYGGPLRNLVMAAGLLIAVAVGMRIRRRGTNGSH